MCIYGTHNQARQSVSSLSHKIGDIKKKAEASEVMVQEICADIKVKIAERKKKQNQKSITSFSLKASANCYTLPKTFAIVPFAYSVDLL